MPSRLQLAKSRGAIPAHADEGHLLDEVLAPSAKRGPDVVVESAGPAGTTEDDQ